MASDWLPPLAAIDLNCGRKWTLAPYEQCKGYTHFVIKTSSADVMTIPEKWVYLMAIGVRYPCDTIGKHGFDYVG